MCSRAWSSPADLVLIGAEPLRLDLGLELTPELAAVVPAMVDVNLILLGEGAVAPGDYVLVQHGQFAYERLDAQAAHEALALIEGVVTAGNGTDVRSW
jgi:hydrogenase maturation factor